MGIDRLHLRHRDLTPAFRRVLPACPSLRQPRSTAALPRYNPSRRSSAAMLSSNREAITNMYEYKLCLTHLDHVAQLQHHIVPVESRRHGDPASSCSVARHTCHPSSVLPITTSPISCFLPLDIFNQWRILQRSLTLLLPSSPKQSSPQRMT